jgi:hypothetical protein
MLLHKPASKYGRGVFFEPLIKELGDFLAKIGSVSEARRLERLQVLGEAERRNSQGALRNYLSEALR